MQELAGHASAQITMDNYAHVNMDIKRSAAEVAADALGSSEERNIQRKSLPNIIVLGGKRSQKTRFRRSGSNSRTI